MFGQVLPRHLEIIYEINRRFLDSVQLRYPGDNDRLARMSIIDESGAKYVRMANLACVGSHAINGVAALHTELVKKDILRDFYEMMPEKFSNKTNGVTPRSFIFGGKAAPGYFMAKLIIKLINGVAEVVNSDSDVGGRLKVAFLPDFDLKSGQLIYPAADLSEQISMAGKEASGTGNMKFAMNGALTIGTLDGANIEIREEVGAENFFLFGLTAEQVKEQEARDYSPKEYYDSDEELRRAIDQIRSGLFSRGDASLFEPLVDSLLWPDDYPVLADYRSYIDCQDKTSQLYRDQNQWTRAAILNVARMGKFSSDRSIREYCEDIWHARPVPIELSPLEI